MSAEQLINTAKKYIGTPYVFGAPSSRTDIFDCSSFVQYVYGVNGIKLPRNSRQQFKVGKRVSLTNVKVGDLLFFTTPSRKKQKGSSKIGHVAIYIGNYSILHTSRHDKQVTVTSLSPYWQKVIIGARRVI